MHIKQSLLTRCIPAAVLATMMISGCGEQQEPQDPAEFYGQPQHNQAEDPIPFTDQNYDFTGETAISQIHEMLDPPDGDYYWYGIEPSEDEQNPENGFPAGDKRVVNTDCNPGYFASQIDEVPELPVRIEGVVTMHPRYYQKVEICGQDNRFYGGYFLQDATGGILVLNDARIADFTFGSRVSLKVRAIAALYDSSTQTYTPAVLAYEDEEVINPDTVYPVYYEDPYYTEEGEEEDTVGNFEAADNGRVLRIEGTVTTEPTGANFNEAIVSGDDGEVWSVSIDRELGNRNVPVYEGDRIRFTGPVTASFGLSMIVASLGQIEHLGEEADEEETSEEETDEEETSEEEAGDEEAAE